MSKFLVTGGCGFIGSHLVDKLVDLGHEVIILDNLSTGKLENIQHQDIKIFQDDIRNNIVQDLVSQVQGVFHLAAIASVEKSTNNWYDSHQVNVSGAVNIFEQACKNNIPVVYASSAAVYGNNSNLPLKENINIKPVSPYGIDKLMCEKHAESMHNINGLNSIGLRFFNVFGPRQDPKSPYSGVISIFLDQILNNNNINIYGDGNQTRDFIYVDDIVTGIYNSMTKLLTSNKLCDVYNLCPGNDISVNSLAETICKLTNNNVYFNYQEKRRGEIEQSFGSMENAKNNIDFITSYNLEQGINNIINYYN